MWELELTWDNVRRISKYIKVMNVKYKRGAKYIRKIITHIKCNVGISRAIKITLFPFGTVIFNLPASTCV